MSQKSLAMSLLIKSIFSSILMSGLLMATVTSCACTDTRKTSASNRSYDRNNEIAAVGSLTPSATRVPVVEAIAKVKSFKGQQVQGKVTFTKVANGIRIVADVDGLSPGKHGFHIHEFGNCQDESTVGAHFNPTNRRHGGPDDSERHVGDLGNLVADATGHAHYERVDNVISFEGENSILGRSIVLHSKADDFKTQPAGDSGDKIACGVIDAVER